MYLRKMRLATEGESTAEAVGDQNQPENGHSLPTAQANGDDNEIESFNADLEKAVKQGHENETENSNSKAFDADGSVTVGTEVKKQEKQQRIGWYILVIILITDYSFFSFYSYVLFSMYVLCFSIHIAIHPKFRRQYQQQLE